MENYKKGMCSRTVTNHIKYAPQILYAESNTHYLYCKTCVNHAEFKIVAFDSWKSKSDCHCEKEECLREKLSLFQELKNALSSWWFSDDPTTDDQSME